MLRSFSPGASLLAHSMQFIEAYGALDDVDNDSGKASDNQRERRDGLRLLRGPELSGDCVPTMLT